MQTGFHIIRGFGCEAENFAHRTAFRVPPPRLTRFSILGFLFSETDTGRGRVRAFPGKSPEKRAAAAVRGRGTGVVEVPREWKCFCGRQATPYERCKATRHGCKTPLYGRDAPRRGCEAPFF